MMHFQTDELIDKFPRGCALFDVVCEVMGTTLGRPRVFEQGDGVNARKVIFSRYVTLVEKIRFTAGRNISDQGCHYAPLQYPGPYSSTILHSPLRAEPIYNVPR